MFLLETARSAAGRQALCALARRMPSKRPNPFELAARQGTPCWRVVSPAPLPERLPPASRAKPRSRRLNPFGRSCWTSHPAFPRFSSGSARPSPKAASLHIRASPRDRRSLLEALMFERRAAFRLSCSCALIAACRVPALPERFSPGALQPRALPSPPPRSDQLPSCLRPCRLPRGGSQAARGPDAHAKASAS